MEAHPRTLKSVFRSDVRLTVPLFQRPYVWSADEQWSPLWEDVLATRERVRHGDSVPHFMGAIVLTLRRGSLGSLEVREVIDGQQRLTTLQLLIAAVRDSLMELGLDGRSSKRLTKLLENDPDLVDDPDEVHKLWPTNRDRDAYRSVLRGDHRSQDYSLQLARIPAAYTWFRAAVDELLASEREDADAVLDSLAEVLLEFLEVVVIDLGEDDNAQVIFETLNARGTALRASDLIKNLVFRTLQDEGRPIEQLYKRYWEPLEAEEWQADVRQGRMVRPRLDAFMGYFLVVLLNREVQAHQLFPATRAWIQKSADRAEQFLCEVARYAEVYERLESLKLENANERASVERMQAVDTTTLTPVLLWLLANTAGRERLSAIRALESYVVRRSLCRLTTKNYNRLFLELLKRLSAGETPVGQVAEIFLAAQQSDSGTWPTSAELRRSFETLPLYKLLKRDRLQRILLALETHASSARTEGIAAVRKLSIEHLLPQKWEESWPIPGDGAEADELRAERQSLVHTIGNLTLVTGSLNATLSNGAWNAKRRHILEHSALTLNRQLPEHWDHEATRIRSNALADLAAELWTRPAVRDDRDLLVDERERDLRPDRDTIAPPTRRAARASGERRDIGKHIVHAFQDLRHGEFLTIAQIRNRRSPEYGDSPPSAGAIFARLFPGNGSTTVPGVSPEIFNGVRGARKL